MNNDQYDLMNENNNINYSEDLFYLNSQRPLTSFKKYFNLFKDFHAVTSIVCILSLPCLFFINFSFISIYLTSICYILGMSHGIKSALLLKEHNENNGKTPISKAIVFSLLSGLLISLPTLLSTDSNRGCF